MNALTKDRIDKRIRPAFEQIKRSGPFLYPVGPFLFAWRMMRPGQTGEVYVVCFSPLVDDSSPIAGTFLPAGGINLREPRAEAGTMNEDADVIVRVVAGDVAAFRVLVERHERRVFGFVRRFLSAADCEDIAQEVFLSAYCNLASYRPAAARFSTWLLAIARNKCLNSLNKRTPAPWDGDAGLTEPIDARTPDAALQEAEFYARLDAALAGLPLEQKTVFVLAELQGLTLAEIGRIEGVSVGTVKSRLSRARAKLREQWVGEDERVQR